MLKGINKRLFAIFKVSLYCLIVLGIVGVLTVLVVIPWWVRTEEVLVPNVTGKTYYEAVRVLDEAGLRPAETIQEASSSAPKGEIVSQNPPANFRVKSYQPVEIAVSIGAELAPVISVIGRSLDEARAALIAAGFRPNRVAYVHSAAYLPDTVIAQTPPEGGGQQRGSDVNLLVSLGAMPQRVQLPDLRTRPLREVMPKLEEVGLHVEIQYSPHPKIPEGSIITHKPAAGELVQSGGIVRLEVSGTRNDTRDVGRLLRLKHSVSEEGNLSRHIRIVVVDEHGERTAVDGKYAPGTVIDMEKQAVRVFGSTRVNIYEDGNKVREVRYQ